MAELKWQGEGDDLMTLEIKLSAEDIVSFLEQGVVAIFQAGYKGDFPGVFPSLSLTIREA